MTGQAYHLTSKCGNIDETFNTFEEAHRWLAKEYPSYLISKKSDGTERERTKEVILPSVCRIRKIKGA